jgi:hypothetical protein
LSGDRSRRRTESPTPPAENRYGRLIEEIFFSHFTRARAGFEFERGEMEKHAARLGIKLPKNLGDIIYSSRYRAGLPERVRATAPRGKQWVILPAGRARYRFAAEDVTEILANKILAETKVPDATPGVISMYALSDEQALLAKLRYNRLIDTFSRVTTYSLQSHLRTQVPGVGQVETDEIYVGVDRVGAHYVFPVQAKGGRDRLSSVQIQQDISMCARKFPSLICRPIGAQFMPGGVMALFEFRRGERGVEVVAEKHYRLVPPDQLSPDEIATYRIASTGEE